MPDYPPEIIQRAAEVRMRQYESEYSAAHLTWRDFEPEVREILDAVAEDLGGHVARRITEHARRFRQPDPSHLPTAWDRHFGIAARVAAQAFLTGDDMKAITARELVAGNYVACFDGATDEQESRLRLPRTPLTGRKMNQADVASPAPEDTDDH